MWDIDFLHKKAQLISKYKDDLKFKIEIFGKETAFEILSRMQQIYFPPVAVVGSPEIWKEEFAYKNSDLIKEINQLRTDILNKVKP